MAALGNKPSIARGVPFKLAAAVAGANTIDFTIPPYAPGREFTAIFVAQGTLTTLASALQISVDGGTTFTDYIAAANFLSATVGRIVVPAASPSTTLLPLVSGVIYRINVTAATGPVDFWIVIN